MMTEREIDRKIKTLPSPEICPSDKISLQVHVLRPSKTSFEDPDGLTSRNI
jgi:hypothetical protein